MTWLTKAGHLACVRSVASVLLMSQMAACSGQEAGGHSQDGANVGAAVTEVHCAEWQALRVADPDDVSMQGHSPGTLPRLIEISPVVITGVVGLQQPFPREGTTLSVVVSSMRGGERFDGTRVDLIWVPSGTPGLGATDPIRGVPYWRDGPVLRSSYDPAVGSASRRILGGL